MNQILLIEDSPEFQLFIKRALEGAGSRVLIAASCSEALASLATHEFDLILIDISLPDGDGFSLCAQLQSDPRTVDIPKVFLTARDDISSKVTAFSLGADDYLVKPVNLLELRARVDSKIRRHKNQKVTANSYRRGIFHIDPLSQKVIIQEATGEKEIYLTPLEFKLLAYLAKNEGQALSRESILDYVWGTSIRVVDRTVDTHISALRRKLEAYGSCIESVSGIGYRFTSAVPQKAVS